MSWFSRGVAIAALLALSGCGFSPLYAPRHQGRDAGGLPPVEVEPIPDRIGQELRNHLVARLPQPSVGVPVPYRLRVDLKENVIEQAQARSGLDTRGTVRIDARFALTAAQDDTVVLSETTRSATSYNLLDARFASLVASEDARSRGLVAIADDIVRRIATYAHHRAERDGPATP